MAGCQTLIIFFLKIAGQRDWQIRRDHKAEGYWVSSSEIAGGGQRIIVVYDTNKAVLIF